MRPDTGHSHADLIVCDDCRTEFCFSKMLFRSVELSPYGLGQRLHSSPLRPARDVSSALPAPLKTSSERPPTKHSIAPGSGGVRLLGASRHLRQIKIN